MTPIVEPAMSAPKPTCAYCGSLLSAVTWTCVRGKHCPGASSYTRHMLALITMTPAAILFCAAIAEWRLA